MASVRIYRALLALVAFAVIVFAFSLESQPRGAGGSQTPNQFFSQSYAAMRSLARAYPDRTPGSAGDQALASRVERTLAAVKGFRVQTQEWSASTAAGPRVLENVIATSPGVSSGEVVVISHRDAAGSPATASLSGTAVMLDLARALSGETLQRSVMLVSTSGQTGSAGTGELAHLLAASAAPIDGVIVLGDLAGATARDPVVVPWSDTDRLAPPLLRNTLSAAVASTAGIRVGGSGLAGQFARLAFPFALTGQAPFAAAGIPAVLLSLSGDEPPRAGAALGTPARLAGLGSAVLQAVNALDGGTTLAAPSGYLTISGKLVPPWAIRLLVLALIAPVAAATLDALARTRRRGHGLLRWVGWVLVGAVPFLVGLVLLLILRVAGAFSAAPPGAVAGGRAAPDGGVPLTGADGALLALVALVVVVSFVFLRPLCLRWLARRSAASRRPDSPAADAAAVALSIVMCALTFVVWAVNPFAALLLVPALHLWLWFAQSPVRSYRPVVAAMPLVAILPGILVGVYYMSVYALSPLDLIWSVALMVGGAMSVGIALCWSVALGCLASAVVIAARSLRAVGAAGEPVVTVRGPASYAGPGSLGGTESALRR